MFPLFWCDFVGGSLFNSLLSLSLFASYHKEVIPSTNNKNLREGSRLPRNQREMLVPTPPADQQLAPAAARPGALVVQQYSVQPSNMKYVIAFSREETSARKDIKEKEAVAFNDLLFSINLMKSDMRKAREISHPKKVWAMNYNAVMEVSKPPGHEKDVWFEPSPTRGVPSPARPVQKLIPPKPRAEVVSLEAEEAELREWVSRLEKKMREPIERTCVEAWLVLTGPQRLEYDAADVMDALIADEAKERECLMKKFKHLTPTSHFIGMVQQMRRREELEIEKDPVSFEAKRRREIEHEADEEKRAAFKWLDTMYGVRLYSCSRIEVSERCDIEEDEATSSSLEDQLLRMCEAEYRWSRLALLALHATKSPFLANIIDRCSKAPK